MTLTMECGGSPAEPAMAPPDHFGPPCLSARRLTKRYGDVLALSDIPIDIPAAPSWAWLVPTGRARPR
jgi:hypothetical protein